MGRGKGGRGFFRHAPRQEDASLDALMSEIPEEAEPEKRIVEPPNPPIRPELKPRTLKKAEPVQHRPFKSWRDDQENWVKAAGMWGK